MIAGERIGAEVAQQNRHIDVVLIVGQQAREFRHVRDHAIELARDPAQRLHEDVTRPTRVIDVLVRRDVDEAARDRRLALDENDVVARRGDARIVVGAGSEACVACHRQDASPRARGPQAERACIVQILDVGAAGVVPRP